MRDEFMTWEKEVAQHAVSLAATEMAAQPS
jgi:hypothetical protein